MCINYVKSTYHSYLVGFYAFVDSLWQRIVYCFMYVSVCMWVCLCVCACGCMCKYVCACSGLCGALLRLVFTLTAHHQRLLALSWVIPISSVLAATTENPYRNRKASSGPHASQTESESETSATAAQIEKLIKPNSELYTQYGKNCSMAFCMELAGCSRRPRIKRAQTAAPLKPTTTTLAATTQTSQAKRV